MPFDAPALDKEQLDGSNEVMVRAQTLLQEGYICIFYRILLMPIDNSLLLQMLFVNPVSQ